MSRKAAWGGSIDAEGASKFLGQLFNNGYAQGLASSQRGAGANMSVDVAAGSGALTTTSGITLFGWSTATENVSVDTANPTNPRLDILVAYMDLSLITTATTNNDGAFKFKAVAGTPAASPTDPSDSTIQAAVGSGNPWMKVSRIQVAAAASTIVNANLTDLRTPMTFSLPYMRGGNLNTKGHQVPNVADKYFALTTDPSGFMNADNVDFGGSGSGIWWKEIGRKKLAISGNTISIPVFPAFKYLRFILSLQSTDGTTDVYMRFNNDAANNYARRMIDFTTGTSNAGSESGAIVTGASTFPHLTFTGEIVNNATSFEKLMTGIRSEAVTAGAASVPTAVMTLHKWVNTSAQITRADVVNVAGTGNFAAGSELIVLGHD